MNKVLIVDDSQELLKPIVLGLQKYKAEFEILTAGNGEDFSQSRCTIFINEIRRNS